MLLSFLHLIVSYCAICGLIVYSARKVNLPHGTSNSSHPRFNTLSRILYGLLCAVGILFLVASLNPWGVVSAKALYGPIALYLLCFLVCFQYLRKRASSGLHSNSTKRVLLILLSFVLSALIADMVIGAVYYLPRIYQSNLEKNRYSDYLETSRTTRGIPDKYKQVEVTRFIDFKEYLPPNSSNRSISNEKYSYNNFVTYTFGYGHFSIRESSYTHTDTLCIQSNNYSCTKVGQWSGGDIYKNTPQSSSGGSNAEIHTANKAGTLLEIIPLSKAEDNAAIISDIINSMAGKKPEKECSPTPLGMIGLLCRTKPHTFTESVYQGDATR